MARKQKQGKLGMKRKPARKRTQPEPRFESCCSQGAESRNAPMQDESVFAFLKPLIESIIALFWLVLIIVVVNFVNSYLRAVFLSALAEFVMENLQWFFAAFLFMRYSRYFSRKMPFYQVAEPVVGGFTWVFFAWVAAWMLKLAGNEVAGGILLPVSDFIFANLLAVFVLATILGYAFLPFGKIFQRICRI